MLGRSCSQSWSPGLLFRYLCLWASVILCFQLSSGESELGSNFRLSLRSVGLGCLASRYVLLAQRSGIVLPGFVSLVLSLETLFGFSWLRAPCPLATRGWQPFSCFSPLLLEWG